MSEQITESDVQKQPQQGKKNRFLIWYTVVLFSFAALIILLSYIYSNEISKESQEQAQNSHQLSLTALQTVETMRQDLVTANERLQEMQLAVDDLSDEAALLLERVETLRNDNERLETQLADGQEALTAAQERAALELKATTLLLDAQTAHLSRDRQTAKALLEQLTPLSEHLSGQGEAERVSPRHQYDDLMEIYS